MKSFRWVIIGLFLVVLNRQSVRASALDEGETFKSAKIGLQYLQIPLSTLQMLIVDNPYLSGNKTAGAQYLGLSQVRELGDCHYVFSVHVDPDDFSSRNYEVYYKMLMSQKYKERKVSPIIMRVLVDLKTGEDYYQGTYKISHGSFPPLRFHLQAIERAKAKNFKDGGLFWTKKGASFDDFSENSRRDSCQISELSKGEYGVTKDGELTRKLKERSDSLEDILGEKIVTPSKKRSPFKKKEKAEPSSQGIAIQPSLEKKEEETEGSLASSSSPSSQLLGKNKRPESPSSRSTRKGNFTLLQEDIDALLKENEQSQVPSSPKAEEPKESSSTFSSSFASSQSSSNQSYSEPLKKEGAASPRSGHIRKKASVDPLNAKAIKK
ncbi:MAG: hypothetical protein J0H12_00450 [Candidatus Paracaedimonas acanthamoebae]|uniref:Uncharacterized protein n=1 Tax=Candidatus Paracaedimonas acanthamoebae TaxID=244581 RepID=A0A8J7PIF7_9PROT|nr:hypothetical protein [Candidatus Paracaedimonas acanthamoebae]